MIKLKRKNSNTSKSLYKIDTMPLVVYIGIIESGDISKIVKEGEYADKEILKAWEEFEHEYGEHVGDKSAIEYAMKSSKIARTQYRLNALHGIRSIWFIDLNFCNGILKDLDIVANSIKQLDARIRNEDGSLRMYIKDAETEGGKVDYYELISTINQNSSANIDIHTHTVRMFCADLKQFMKQQKQREKARNGR